MNSGMILENTIPPFSIGNHFWYVTMGIGYWVLGIRYWDNTVTPGEELSVNTYRFLRIWGPIRTDGRRPEVCID